jgi:hypothetical protein
MPRGASRDHFGFARCGPPEIVIHYVAAVFRIAMAIGVVVYGVIQCPAWGWSADGKRLYRHNRRVISHLPESDADWPFLTKGMFSVPPLRVQSERRVPQYEHQIIHFAGEYKNMVILEAAWIRKFELLLSKLCWYSATVTNDFSKIQYDWAVSLGGEQTRGYLDNVPRPPSEWSFRCSGIDLRPLTRTEAVDGILTSEHHSVHPAAT